MAATLPSKREPEGYSAESASLVGRGVSLTESGSRRACPLLLARFFDFFNRRVCSMACQLSWRARAARLISRRRGDVDFFILTFLDPVLSRAAGSKIPAKIDFGS